MSRLPRIFIPEQPLHLVARGHNKQPIVAAWQDHARFVSYLARASDKYGVAVHAWVLMSNHIHLLLTPERADSLPGMMQWLGRGYARYFNKRYQRSGALWESRYKTSFIDTDHYLLACHRYIELNPVRAGMARRPEHYRWSSYRQNALGLDEGLVTPHQLYMELGKDPESRRLNYRGLFGDALGMETVNRFREGAAKGAAVGRPEFRLGIACRCQSKKLL